MAARVDDLSLLIESTDQDHLLINNCETHKLAHAVKSKDNSKSSLTCCGHQYLIQYINSKGALLVLMWGFMLHCVIPIPMSVHLLSISINTLERRDHGHLPNYASSVIYAALFVLYPVMGWIADARIGRYRALKYSIGCIFIAGMCMVFGYSFHIASHYANNSFMLKLLSAILLGLGVLLNVCGFACFDANVIPFLTDQILGASGDELSALIHWHFWFSALAAGINNVIQTISWIIGNHYLTLATIILHFLCTLVVLISCFLGKHWLDITPKITNPINLIIKVINYAIKTKSPKNRSAFTFTGKLYSRIDYGKRQYGGPFSEEQVEDVKTTLRLLPFILLSVGFSMKSSPFSYTERLEQPSIKDNCRNRIIMFLFENSTTYYSFFTIVFLIVFHTVLYPLFHRNIPSVLKRVGFGLVLTAASLLYLSAFDIIAQSSNNYKGNVCLLANVDYEQHNKLKLGFYWGLPAIILRALGELFAATFAIEFLIAQAPGPMKGVMVGLWFFFCSALGLFSIHIYHAFKSMSPSSRPSCIFYYNFTKTVICFSLVVLYIRFASRYQFRTRNIPDSIYQHAEDYYTKYGSMNAKSAAGASNNSVTVSSVIEDKSP